MKNIFAMLLLAIFVLTGAGCAQQEEEVQEPQVEESGLYDEADVQEVSGYEAHAPGYWTFKIVVPGEGEIDSNLALFDDGTAQGLFGSATVYNAGSQHINYGANDTGSWEMVGEATLQFAGGSVQPFTGTFTSETSMSGSMVDTAGSTWPWTALKTGEIDRVLAIAGEWMLNFTVNGQERFEEIHCAQNGLCEVVWEKYPGQYEGAPSEERFYTYHHDGGYDFQLESTDGSLSLDLNAGWEDYWGGWEADGTATNNGDGSSDSAAGVKTGNN
jgi:hypothetical protein